MTTPRNRRAALAHQAARIMRPVLTLGGTRPKSAPELRRAWERETAAYLARHPRLPRTPHNAATARALLAAEACGACALADWTEDRAQ